MPRLIDVWRENMRHSAGGDRGAAATIVAVLLAGGVLLGMTALVVDVGQLYAEREELLSVADATAFNTALDCAQDRTACSDEDALAKALDLYAAEMVRDGFADVIICGSDSRLSDCDDPAFDPAGNLTDCLGERPTNGAGYVEVRASTLLPDGSTLFPPSFAQTLVAGYDGSTVGACSRVAYGSPTGGLAVTLSDCEWRGATEAGTKYPPADASSELLRDEYEVIMFTHDSHGEADCFNGPPHFDGPGGFGWLEGDDCQVVITGGTYNSQPTNNAPPPCRVAIPELRDSGTPVLIPVYDVVTPPPPGPGLTYRLDRIAAFVITGYRLTGSVSSGSSLPGSTKSCTGSDRCIIGYFLQDGPIDWDGPIGDPSIQGPVVIRTVG